MSEHPPAQPFAPPVVESGPEFFATRMPCLRCGYDLRTMPVAGRCPECGAACEESLGSMWAADAEDRERLVRGLRMMVWATVAFPLVAAGFTTIDVRMSTSVPRLSLLGLAGVGCVGPMLAQFGVTMLSVGVRAARNVAHARPMGTMASVVGMKEIGWVYVVCSTLAALLLGLLASETVRRPGDEWAWALGTLGVGTGLGWTVRNLCVGLRCAEIAGLSNRPGQRRLFRVLAWMSGVGTAIVLGYALAGILINVFHVDLFNAWPSPRQRRIAVVVMSVRAITGFVAMGGLGWMLAWAIALGVLSRDLRKMGEEVRAGGGVMIQRASAEPGDVAASGGAAS